MGITQCLVNKVTDRYLAPIGECHQCVTSYALPATIGADDRGNSRAELQRCTWREALEAMQLETFEVHPSAAPPAGGIGKSTRRPQAAYHRTDVQGCGAAGNGPH